MKYVVVLLVIMWLVSSVSAQSFLDETLSSVYNLALSFLISAVFISAIVGLQYFGIDIIGMTFSVITFFVDLFFSVLGNVTSREESLISAVLLFVVIMAILMGLL